MLKLDRGLKIFGVLSIFLALAPFSPEPHLFGKMRWLLGGAAGMNSMDYFDLLLHGLPLTSFIFIAAFSIGKNLTRN